MTDRKMEPRGGARKGEGGEIRKEKDGEMFFLSAVLISRTSTECCNVPNFHSSNNSSNGIL